jgi:hypothetical protein
MKYKFESGEKFFDVPTKSGTTAQEFCKALSERIFKDKTPSCTFVVTNYRPVDVLDLEKPPVVKKHYATLFTQDAKKAKPAPPKKRWRSRSPVRRWRE